MSLSLTFSADCGYNAHKQCKDETAPNCQPTKQLVKRGKFTAPLPVRVCSGRFNEVHVYSTIRQVTRGKAKSGAVVKHQRKVVVKKKTTSNVKGHF